jgi:sugar-specific transcriptional regulator TrmB
MLSEQDNQETQRLQSLGLTLNQARVYLALVKAEKTATAKTLSATSGLAACDVYRVVPELTKLGLLEVLVVSPKEFRAVPPEEAIEILIIQREKEVEDMHATAKEFIAELHHEKNSESSELNTTALIPNGYRASQFGMPKLLATKGRLDAVQTNVLFRRFLANTSDSLEVLLGKKVELRFVIESSAALERPDENLSALLEKEGFKLRFAKERIQACVLLHDDTNAFVSTSLDTVHTPSYWSNNPCFVAVARSFFESTWEKSLEKPSSELLSTQKPQSASMRREF